jgi:hypothetical protein
MEFSLNLLAEKDPAPLKPLRCSLRAIPAQLHQQIRKTLVDPVQGDQACQGVATPSAAFFASDENTLVALNQKIAERHRAASRHGPSCRSAHLPKVSGGEQRRLDIIQHLKASAFNINSQALPFRRE